MLPTDPLCCHDIVSIRRNKPRFFRGGAAQPMTIRQLSAGPVVRSSGEIILCFRRSSERPSECMVLFSNQGRPPSFWLSQNKRSRAVKLTVLAIALALIGSVALAQPAPIGSSADFGNGAALNRGPVRTTGEDLDFRTDRSSRPRLAHPRQARCAKHRRRHVADYRH